MAMGESNSHATDVASSLAQESSICDNLTAPEARFECPICLAWLRDPVLTSCGHRFCRKCIQSWLEHNSCCPVDNMKLEKNSDIFPDNFTRREISQQRTRCPNISRGCFEELSPLDIETHLLTCRYKIPELPENEKLRCCFVHVGCKLKFEDEPELQRHIEQDVSAHLTLLSDAYGNMVLNKESSSSAMAQQANFWDPPAKNPESSIDSSKDDSIQALIRSLYEKIIVLEQKSREQDIIIANMSQQISTNHLAISKLSFRYCCGSWLWYVTDFKNKVNTMRNNPQIMHYSPGFYTSPNGYKLCMRINLSPKDPNYLAILVHMMKTDHDNTLEWPFTGRITVTLIHPTQSFRNIKETMMSRSELEAFTQPVQELNHKGFGYTEFTLLEYLLEQGFVGDNKLIIKINAQPV